MNQRQTLFLFDQPDRYCISVQGQLGTLWSSRLRDMEIVVKGSASQKPVTILTGEVRDQAALMGVLNTLYDMRCAVLKVEQLGQLPRTNEAKETD